jgi:hypothetical protein
MVKFKKDEFINRILHFGEFVCTNLVVSTFGAEVYFTHKIPSLSIVYCLLFTMESSLLTLAFTMLCSSCVKSLNLWGRFLKESFTYQAPIKRAERLCSVCSFKRVLIYQGLQSRKTRISGLKS